MACRFTNTHITAGQSDFGDRIGSGAIDSAAWLTYHPFGCFSDDPKVGWFPLDLDEAEKCISAQQVPHWNA